MSAVAELLHQLRELSAPSLIGSSPAFELAGIGPIMDALVDRLAAQAGELGLRYPWCVVRAC